MHRGLLLGLILQYMVLVGNGLTLYTLMPVLAHRMHIIKLMGYIWRL